METKEKNNNSLGGVYALLIINLVLTVIFGIVLSYLVVVKSPKINSIEGNVLDIESSLSELIDTADETSSMIRKLESKIEESTKKSVSESSLLEEKESQPTDKLFKDDDFPFTFSYDSKYLVYLPGTTEPVEVKENQIFFLDEETKKSIEEIKEKELATEGPLIPIIINYHPDEELDDFVADFEETFEGQITEERSEITIGEYIVTRYSVSGLDEIEFFLIPYEDGVIEVNGLNAEELEDLTRTLE